MPDACGPCWGARHLQKHQNALRDNTPQLIQGPWLMNKKQLINLFGSDKYDSTILCVSLA